MKLIDKIGVIYDSIHDFARKTGVSRRYVQTMLKKKGYYENKARGIIALPYSDDMAGSFPVTITTTDVTDIVNVPSVRVVDEEYENFKAARQTEYKIFKIDKPETSDGFRYAIALFSDAHIDETVNPDSVLGLNEYDTEIAKERVSAYFANLATCLKRDAVSDLYFASLGDTISGFIHPHLEQENGMTPQEAVLFGQSLIVSGMKYLREKLPAVSITFIGISGNHSRTTKKIQASNGYKLSYEWIMYHNVKQICEGLELDIEFIIPESELALIETPDNKRYIFCHGFQVQSKGTGTVAGIYPALQRLAMKWQKVFQQDKIFLGHYHTNVSIPTATVNGSIIGYNAFALSNGMGYEEPAQQYEVYDSEVGQLLSRKIYCK
jgi:hypothetical protein